MKALVCELCGSNAIVKQDDLFVCQHCGTKHVLEGNLEKVKDKKNKKVKDKSLENEKTFSKEDLIAELENLIKSAQRARIEGWIEHAFERYEAFLEKRYENIDHMEDIRNFTHKWEWEAFFYYCYFNVMNSSNDDMYQKAAKFSRNIKTTLSSLDDDRFSSEEKVANAEMIANDCIKLADFLFDTAKNHFDNIQYSYIKEQSESEMVEKCSIARDIAYMVGDTLTLEALPFCKHDGLLSIAVAAWKNGIDKHYKIHKSTSISVDVPLAMTYKVKIKEYDKDYESPTFGGKGCYIATCVYGSYDCPEVWVLRRFRDKVLAKNVFGRAFINIYYAISPKLVKAFGKRPLFRNICQKPLDIFVRHLHKKGFADTRYKDPDYK